MILSLMWWFFFLLCRAWVLRAVGEPTRELFVLGFGETHQGWTMGLTSLKDSPRADLGLCEPFGEMTCRTYQRRTLGFVSPLEKQPIGLTKGEPWVLRVLWRTD